MGRIVDKEIIYARVGMIWGGGRRVEGVVAVAWKGSPPGIEESMPAGKLAKELGVP